MNSARVWRFVRAAAPLAFFLVMPSAVWAGDLGVCASTASGHGVLTDLAQQFQTATSPWMTAALGYARGLFFALIGIELAWSGITYVLQKDGLSEFLAALVMKLLSVSFFFMLLQPEYGPTWIGDIITSFMQAGSNIGGQPTFGPGDPSAIFNCGTDIAGAMMDSLSHRGFSFDLIGIGEAFLTALLCALGVMIGFAVAAGQLLITLVESYIVIGAGVFMLGFSGSRWTLIFSEKYFGYVWSVAIKLFMLQLIVGLGYGLGQQWAALFSADSVPPSTYIEVLGGALVFGFLAWQIPGMAAAMMNGSPRMTLGAFLSNVGTVMVGGVVVGSGLVGAATGATAVASKGLDALRQAAGATQAASEAGVAGAAGGAAEGAGSGIPQPGSVRQRLSSGEEPGYGGAARRPDPSPEDDPGPDSGGTGAYAEPEASSDDAATDGGDAPDDPGESSLPPEPPPEDLPPAPSGGKPRKPSGSGGFRMPPIPDDAADGSIHIRFQHPE